MKKIILVALTLISLSCSKEENLPSPSTQTQTSNCNCGTIVSDQVSDYSIEIRNSCSGNVKKFVLYEADWMTAYVGTNYCITNTSGW